jgi:hypothetical protein
MRRFIMRVFKIFIVSLFSLLILSGIEIKSDVGPGPKFGEKEPCTYFWPNLEWTGPAGKIITVGGCTYLIEYYYRTNPLDREELQIVAYYKIGGDNCTASYAEIQKAAYVSLWIDNPMGFDPDNSEYVAQQYPCIEFTTSGGDEHWDLEINPALLDTSMFYGLVYVINPTNGFIVFQDIDFYYPCFDSVCCRMFYKITREFDNGPIVSIEWLEEGAAPQPECEYPNRCSAACNSLKFDWYAPGYEPENFTSVLDKEKKKNNSKIFPNPNESSFTLYFNSEVLGEMHLFIYNNIGEIMLHKQYYKNIKDFSTSINMETLSNGVYYYNVKINSSIVTMGSFIISK